MKTILCRALKTSLDTSWGGYGKVNAGDIIHLNEYHVDQLVKEGQFEKVELPQEALFVETKEDLIETKVIVPEEQPTLEAEPDDKPKKTTYSKKG